MNFEYALSPRTIVDWRIEHVAVVGAGRVGTTLAHALVSAGYKVSISGSGDPKRIKLPPTLRTPRVQRSWTSEAVSRADLSILALPTHRLCELDCSQFVNRIVIDATNYWPAVDGPIHTYSEETRGSSEILQQLLPGARVIKALNHVWFRDFLPDRRPAGHPERLTLLAAGDDVDAMGVVTKLIDSLGYDPVALRPLITGCLFEPEGILFGAKMSASQTIQRIREVVRWDTNCLHFIA